MVGPELQLAAIVCAEKRGRIETLARNACRTDKVFALSQNFAYTILSHAIV